ncbi:MAG: single-stranded DNA-binding protein [Lachnospiraceae bacterium]|nr:single-stranded DNA-binding protein [Lachnospiraceae bacterium]
MLNKQITMGRLTADPELRYTPNGVAVTSFTLACRESAEFICRYMQKGRLVVAEGRPKARKYTDKNGSNHKVVELHIDRIYFADSNKNQNNGQDGQSYVAPEGGADFEEINTSDEDLPF